jgi:ABC-2 type transport system ATP-binding protein
MTAPAIRIDALRVVRGGRPVLPGLTLSVPAGQVVAVLGPSGCGKTTLLRCVVGVQRVAGGIVEVFEMPAGSRALRPRIGYRTQSAGVYPDLTVAENLRYFATVVGTRRTGVDDEVRRVLDVVALGEHARTRVDRLSGGQLSRVSLAVALAGRPDLLVLDEPTVGLDPVLRRELWTVFRELAAGGVTLLVSSHVMDEAARCDRVVLLRDGALLADDTPSGLRAATGTTDVEQAFLTLVEHTGEREVPM